MGAVVSSRSQWRRPHARDAVRKALRQEFRDHSIQALERRVAGRFNHTERIRGTPPRFSNPRLSPTSDGVAGLTTALRRIQRMPAGPRSRCDRGTSWRVRNNSRSAPANSRDILVSHELPPVPPLVRPWDLLEAGSLAIATSPQRDTTHLCPHRRGVKSAICEWVQKPFHPVARHRPKTLPPEKALRTAQEHVGRVA